MLRNSRVSQLRNLNARLWQPVEKQQRGRVDGGCYLRMSQNLAHEMFFLDLKPFLFSSTKRNAWAHIACN